MSGYFCGKVSQILDLLKISGIDFSFPSCIYFGFGASFYGVRIFRSDDSLLAGFGIYDIKATRAHTYVLILYTFKSGLVAITVDKEDIEFFLDIALKTIRKSRHHLVLFVNFLDRLVSLINEEAADKYYLNEILAQIDLEGEKSDAVG